MTSRRTPLPPPWRDIDITIVAITVLLGLITILTAWFNADHTASPTSQAMWLNLAVAGFAVSATGCGLWLMRGRRAIGERRATLVSLDRPTPEPPPPPTRPTHTAPTQSVRIPGTRHIHHPDCPLVTGKAVKPAALTTGEPCRVCTP